MLSYYSTIIMLSWMTLAVLCILVWENDRINPKNKRIFYLTYALIALSALSEWIGIQITGNENIPRWVMIFVKTADHILTPMAGGAMVGQMKTRTRYYRSLLHLLGVNAVFQIIGAFFGWVVRVDEHNVYSHGSLYFVYIIVYLTVILFIISGFIAYGKTFRKQNRRSLYAIILLVITGIAMQEALGGEHRTVYISLTLGAAMMFIHYSEFSQLRLEDRLSEQYIQISTDALTGALSRYAYTEALNGYASAGNIPDDLAIFLVDINGLKTVNDTLGHEAGDELIRGAAKCVEKTIGKNGKTYRIGGDEFVVITNIDSEHADAAVKELDKAVRQWSGKKVKKLSVSSGYAVARDCPGCTPEELAKKADEAMYTNKTAYYRENGIERRKH